MCFMPLTKQPQSNKDTSGWFGPAIVTDVNRLKHGSVTVRYNNRLREAGAESKLWPTQFGFRTGYGTGDVLFIARRILNEVWSRKDGKAIFLALDWRRAFDCTAPSRLLWALERVGPPRAFLRCSERHIHE